MNPRLFRAGSVKYAQLNMKAGVNAGVHRIRTEQQMGVFLRDPFSCEDFGREIPALGVGGRQVG